MKNVMKKNQGAEKRQCDFIYKFDFTNAKYQ